MTRPGVWPQAKKGTRIRQGSPQEEAALAEHLTTLAPRKETLSDSRQLAEVMVVLGHVEAAMTLQAALDGLVAEQKVPSVVSIPTSLQPCIHAQPCSSYYHIILVYAQAMTL